MIVVENSTYLELINLAKIEKRSIEKELQKALAIEFVKEYCKMNNLSIDKLKEQRFELNYNECGFFQSSAVKPNGLLNDRETMPKPTLLIKHENGYLQIEETEYTKEYLKLSE